MLEEREKQSKFGGIAFYISLLVLSCLAGFNLFMLPWIYDPERRGFLLYFFGMFLVGVWIARSFVKGRISIFIHELKHSIVSNLVGNRAKRLKVKDKSGYFAYEYTVRTAHMNAFIALAPYYFPLATIAILIPALLFAFKNHLLLALALGVGQGIDYALNAKDISPHQTDFSELRGGFFIGLLYVLIANLFLSSLALVWLCGGSQAFLFLPKALGALIIKLGYSQGVEFGAFLP